jgi:hypothetical protein
MRIATAHAAEISKHNRFAVVLDALQPSTVPHAMQHERFRWRALIADDNAGREEAAGERPTGPPGCDVEGAGGGHAWPARMQRSTPVGSMWLRCASSWGAR